MVSVRVRACVCNVVHVHMRAACVLVCVKDKQTDTCIYTIVADKSN